MNKLSAERLLSLIQTVMVPVLLVLILIGVALEARAASDGNPSMELLEFLGEWETEEGDWIDPMRFLDIEVDELESKDLSKVKLNEDSSND